MRDNSFLGKLLALTESTNKHEANLAKAKLEQQLEKRGIRIVPEVQREKGQKVLRLYMKLGGKIYNATR